MDVLVNSLSSRHRNSQSYQRAFGRISDKQRMINNIPLVERVFAIMHRMGIDNEFIAEFSRQHCNGSVKNAMKKLLLKRRIGPNIIDESFIWAASEKGQEYWANKNMEFAELYSCGVLKTSTTIIENVLGTNDMNYQIRW